MKENVCKSFEVIVQCITGILIALSLYISKFALDNSICAAEQQEQYNRLLLAPYIEVIPIDDALRLYIDTLGCDSIVALQAGFRVANRGETSAVDMMIVSTMNHDERFPISYLRRKMNEYSVVSGNIYIMSPNGQELSVVNRYGYEGDTLYSAFLHVYIEYYDVVGELHGLCGTFQVKMDTINKIRIKYLVIPKSFTLFAKEFVPYVFRYHVLVNPYECAPDGYIGN